MYFILFRIFVSAEYLHQNNQSKINVTNQRIFCQAKIELPVVSRILRTGVNLTRFNSLSTL